MFRFIRNMSCTRFKKLLCYEEMYISGNHEMYSQGCEPKNTGITSSSQSLTAVFLEIKVSKGSVQFT